MLINAVAPFAGAWIEIYRYYSRPEKLAWSLPSRERGLKYVQLHNRPRQRGRSLRGSVD